MELMVTASPKIKKQPLNTAERGKADAPPEKAPGAKDSKLKPPAAAEEGTSAVPVFDLNDSEWYLNRELTWLEFNQRVLHEAEDSRTPLLERLKFIAIVSSNLDEFFMKRIGGLK